MNAPANIPHSRRIRADETPREAVHRRAISVFCPNCDEMEMAARVDLATMRDQASTGMALACPMAATMLAEVMSAAAQAVYAPLPGSRLIRIAGALNLTMMAARAVERAQRDG